MQATHNSSPLEKKPHQTGMIISILLVEGLFAPVRILDIYKSIYNYNYNL